MEVSQSQAIFEVDDKAISDVYWISGEGKDPRGFTFAEKYHGGGGRLWEQQ